jgi:hypothetical protein
MSTWRTRFGIQLLQILSLIPVLLLANLHAATVEEKQPLSQRQAASNRFRLSIAPSALERHLTGLPMIAGLFRRYSRWHGSKSG